MAEQALETLNASSVFDLRGVVAVVTGGGTGIGLMISTTLMSNGAKVYIVGPPGSLAEFERVAKLYNEAAEKRSNDMCGRLHALEADVRHKTEARRLASVIEELEPNGITTLFNNAGIASGHFKRPSNALTPSSDVTAQDYMRELFDPVSEEDFGNVYHTNAVGPYWFSLAFLPLLEKWKKAPIPAAKRFVPQVIMISSMNGWSKDAATCGFSFPYMFSKSAIGHATASLAHELIPLGIRVNGIAPGLFITQLSSPGPTDELGRGHLRLPEGTTHSGSFTVPTGQTGSARDMGTLALFLVANWFVNGETVLIDGGTMLVHPSSY
ncbi:hypothetical protein AX16_010546 [Volvariella volvacea WC 439]|nr:hypothetical protein AX16_010546 [Volvariella volvacea WC 439]